MEFQYSKIEPALVDALPELHPAAERYWAIEGRPGEDSGPYIFYEDMFGAYLEILLALNPTPRRDRLLTRAFDFLEGMLMSADTEVANLAYIAILEGRNPWWLTRAKPFLGSQAIAALDRWSEGWRGDIDTHWNTIGWPGAKHIIDLYSTRLVVASEVAADGVQLESVPGDSGDLDDKAT